MPFIPVLRHYILRSGVSLQISGHGMFFLNSKADYLILKTFVVGIYILTCICLHRFLRELLQLKLELAWKGLNTGSFSDVKYEFNFVVVYRRILQVLVQKYSNTFLDATYICCFLC